MNYPKIYLKVESGKLYVKWPDDVRLNWMPLAESKFFSDARKGIWEVDCYCQGDSFWESLFEYCDVIIIEEDNDN
jgi:hypothetical protein